ncbi:MAG: hypothetical protein ABIO88_13295, partial [Burkholderiaceae bacterium]
LPQVAACADHHLVVAKQLVGSSTESSVTPVLDQQRVAEIARMLGGERVTDATLIHATEMIAVQQTNTPATTKFNLKNEVVRKITPKVAA